MPRFNTWTHLGSYQWEGGAVGCENVGPWVGVSVGNVVGSDDVGEPVGVAVDGVEVGMEIDGAEVGKETEGLWLGSFVGIVIFW